MNFTLDIYNFRLFDHSTFNFNNSIVLINGKNKSGKSSILESLFILKTGRSYRANSLNYCIKNGEKFFSIELKSDINEKFIYNDQSNKSYFINDKKEKPKIVNPFIYILYNKNIFNFIFFRDFRRKILDELISNIDQTYFFKLLNYKKLCEKKKEIIYSTIDLKMKIKLYEQIVKNIADYTGYIIEKRNEIIDKCKQFLSNFTNYNIEYNSKFLNFSIENITKIYLDSFTNEIEQKRYIGPHNDYYNLFDKYKNLIESGANSDFYNFYFYLHLFFILTNKKDKNIYPIILFDDFFLPLDLSSINNILSFFDEKDFLLIAQHERFDIKNKSFDIITL